MDYQVWIKDEFGDTYTKVDCGDLDAAKREVDRAVRVGAEPILTIEVPYSLAIKVEAMGTEKPKRRETVEETEKRLKEEAEREANQGEAKSSESTRAPGKGQV